MIPYVNVQIRQANYARDCERTMSFINASNTANLRDTLLPMLLFDELHINCSEEALYA